MGVAPELIPADLNKAAELNALIWKPAIWYLTGGSRNAARPLSLLKENTPAPIVWAPVGTVRYLVPPDAGNMIGIPRDRFGCLTVRLFATFNRLASRTLGLRQPPFFRRFGLKVVEWLIRVDRGHSRAHLNTFQLICVLIGEVQAPWRRTFWQRWFERLF